MRHAAEELEQDPGTHAWGWGDREAKEDVEARSGEWGWDGGAASALNLRGASPGKAGEVQVPGWAALTCASSALWGTRRKEDLLGKWWKYPP
jgi:hypothetical protein